MKAILLLLSFAVTQIQAQNFELKSVKIKTFANLQYLGADAEYQYFSSGVHKVIRFNIKNPLVYKEINYELEEKWLRHEELSYFDQKLISISETSIVIKNTRSTSYRFNIYTFDASNGNKLHKAHFQMDDSSSASYTCELDSVSKYVYVFKDKVIVQAYDMNMNESANRRPGKHNPKPIPLQIPAEILRMFTFSNQQLPSSFLKKSTGLQYDSLSLEFYNLSYTIIESEGIYYFKSFIKDIIVRTKQNKFIELELDADKKILDFNYREDKNGRLYIFGKYFIKGSMNNQHGMFSVMYDKNLKQLSSLKYFDIANLPDFKSSVPNMKYAGFVYFDLRNPNYEFYMENENAFIFTYQKGYYNLQDHIYILKVDSNAVISVQMISNQLQQQNKLGYNEMHMALRSGNSIHIVFYDHKDNIGMPASDLDFVSGSIDKGSTVIAVCTYNVPEESLTNKKLIETKKNLPALPQLLNPAICYDPNLNQYTCLLRARNNKGLCTYMFQLLYN